jgi:hypothetical protein
VQPSAATAAVNSWAKHVQESAQLPIALLQNIQLTTNSTLQPRHTFVHLLQAN